MADSSNPDSFLTIDHEGRGRLTEKMSRFLGFAFEVETATDARARVKELTNEYHDARHVCWAYVLGPTRSEYLYSDNGEPSGTAGKPILGQINSRGLTNVLVAVVRYFGGIKLGTPGLIAAYRETASLTLDDSGVREVTRHEQIRFEVGYEQLDPVMRLIKERQLTVLGQEIEMQCIMTLSVPLNVVDDVRERLKKIPRLKFI